MRKSVLEAIKMGDWDYEPPKVEAEEFSSTDAMPGSREKLGILAERVKQGLPLWHPSDRSGMDEPYRSVKPR